MPKKSAKRTAPTSRGNQVNASPPASVIQIEPVVVDSPTEAKVTDSTHGVTNVDATSGEELDEPSSVDTTGMSSPSRAKLAILVYLCGDNHIAATTDQYSQAIKDAAPLENIHIVVQHDRPDQASRFFIRAGTKEPIKSPTVRRDVNTGSPEALSEFLEWALQIPNTTADHYVLLFAGLGINPRYVRQTLPLEILPAKLREARGGKPEDPNDPKVTQRFLECFNELSPNAKASYREAIQSRAFTICHDFSNSGSLQISDLRDVLADATKWFAESKADARFDLVFFFMGATAFIEVLFELEGLAQVYIGSPDRLPDEGLPFNTIFRNWDQRLVEPPPETKKKNAKTERSRASAKPEPVGVTLAKSCLQTLATASNDDYYKLPQLQRNEKPIDLEVIQASLDQIVAVNIDALDELARSLDSLAVALLHSLGDWHVKNAIERAQVWERKTDVDVQPKDERSHGGRTRITADEPGKDEVKNGELDEIEFLPADNLFEWLDGLEEAFARKLEASEANGKATDMSKAVDKQQVAIRRLYESVAKTRLQSDSFPAKIFNQIVDLEESLEPLLTVLETENDAEDVVPQSHGQLDRIRKLYKLVRKTIAHLRSAKLSRSRRMPGRLFIEAEDHSSTKDLLVMMPPLRTPEEIQKELRTYSAASESYSRLNFSRRVHWSALLGTLQMIREKPHTLWRVISSMLVDASSPARDAVLNRLISRQSVISDMRGQFRSLGESESLSLSFDHIDNGEAPTDLARFQVRLEPSLGGSIIFQNESRVYRSSLDAIWQDLTNLMKQTGPRENLVKYLRSLGASLGEDIIQDLGTSLENARLARMNNPNETPHLTLQIPRDFMRYPWELMNDREGLLLERYALGRQVFMESRFARSTSRQQSNKIRVLVVGDPLCADNFQIPGSKWRPSPLPGARVEAETIAELFAQLHEEMAGIVEFEVTCVIGLTIVRGDMRRYLRDGNFDIIHFAGHAVNNEKEGDGSGWILSDGELHAREIRNTLSWSKRPPWLIFANACEAGMDISDKTSSSDVSGLATACISNGVAAYIAPLWPVDDEVARWLAVDFYRQLLKERFTVGESLCKARLSIWNMLKDSGSTSKMPAQTALTWASFILYGDPTARLLSMLWSPVRESTGKKVSNAGQRKRPVVANVVPRFRNATIGQICNDVDVPQTLLLSAHDARRSATESQARPDKLHSEKHTNEAKTKRAAALQKISYQLQLVEREGLRFWRAVKQGGDQRYLTISNLGKLLNDQQPKNAQKRKELGERIGQDRGVLSDITPIKRWRIKRLVGRPTQALIDNTVVEFDQHVVPDQRLIRYMADGDARILSSEASLERSGRSNRMDDGEWLDRQIGTGQLNRVLLILHGTLSNSAQLINDFQQTVQKGLDGPLEDESLLNWMLRRYRAVLAYDHWTLSKSPEENARELANLLPKHVMTSKGKREKLQLDIIAHGRGGIVARCLAELIESDVSVQRVAFVGTPHAGTRLAQSSHWGEMADSLINQIHHDPTGTLCRLSSFFAYMRTQRIEGSVRGLQDLIPLSEQSDQRSDSRNDGRCDTGSEPPLLERLKKIPPQFVDNYFVVASNFTPSRDSMSLNALLREVDDDLVDSFFERPNDLLTETDHMWALDQQPAWIHPLERETDKSSGWHSAPPAIPGKNILLFNTGATGPTAIDSEPRAGLHHFNYFAHWRVREFIRERLDP